MSDCNQIADECPPLPKAGEAWSVCLPWGGRIYSTGSHVYAQPGSPPPDGTYGKIVIANGCIVGVEPEDVPLYTGSPCAPLPGDCGGGGSPGVSGGGGGGGSGGCCPPSSASGNLYQLDASGRPLVKCSIKGGDGLTITGSGTTSDPYVISSSGSGGSGGGIAIKSLNDAIAVKGGNQIEHKKGKQGTVNGMVFDAYGHLVDTTSGTANKGVQGLIPGSGIDITTDQSGISTIGLRKPANDLSGSYNFGGFEIQVDDTGRFYAIEQRINLGGNQVEHWGTKDVEVDTYGSIINIVETYNPGTAYMMAFGNGGAYTHRWAEFTTILNTMFIGLLYTGGPPELFASLSITIDGQPCGRGYPNTRFDILEETGLRTQQINFPFPFTSPGVLMAGKHRIDIQSTVAWIPEDGAEVLLFAAGAADAIGNS